MVVWDGMRPDFVNEKDAPVLWKLAKDGVVFRRHHAVYPSATEVNGVALATGLYPEHNGMIANHEYRPAIDGKKSIDTEIPEVVRKGDEATNGGYIAATTIAELARKAGRQTAVAGSKGIALLFDRHLDATREQNGASLFAGYTLPEKVLNPIVATLGIFPRWAEVPAAPRDHWTTQALTDFLWKNGVPDFSLLWLAEPDASEHEFAPGSKESLAAIRSADGNLEQVLAALDRHGAREITDLFVVSDHGFSTIERSIDLKKILRKVGFDAVTQFVSEPKRGQVMLVGNGGTVLFYVIQHDSSVIARLVAFLQRSDFAGVIFTKQPIKGAFRFAQAMINYDRAPDVEMAFRWNRSKNRSGVSGMIDADWNRAAGQGTHATLSRFDMHNTLIASGPDFRRGVSDDLPTGNVDVAPTVLQILGIKPWHSLDGRVLVEVMTNDGTLPPTPETEIAEAERKFQTGVWKQTLILSHVGKTVYIDEGNGQFHRAK